MMESLPIHKQHPGERTEENYAMPSLLCQSCTGWRIKLKTCLNFEHIVKGTSFLLIFAINLFYTVFNLLLSHSMLPHVTVHVTTHVTKEIVYISTCYMLLLLFIKVIYIYTSKK